MEPCYRHACHSSRGLRCTSTTNLEPNPHVLITGSRKSRRKIGKTQFADFNYKTGAVSQRTVANTEHDMFCPGISSLQDGRIIITGGQDADATSFYDPATDTFEKGPAMNIPRGYQSSATTSSGKVCTIGGSYSGGIGNKTGEIFDPVAKYMDNSTSPSKQQNWYDTTGEGTTIEAGIRDPDNDAMCGVNVIDAFTKSYITTIGNPYEPSVVEQVSDMINPRGFANAVVLPDGMIFITGRQKRSLVFTDTDSILAPELFDPVTKTFMELAPAAISRNYHSVSLLLADGTVFTGGGGMCYTFHAKSDADCNREADHPSAEIFSPPYLFNDDGTSAIRPNIMDFSNSTSDTGLNVTVGGILIVTMDIASSFSLIRVGSATHSINTDQRRIPLTDVVADGGTYTIQLPDDSGVMIPGFYYLFAISEGGVPSVARTVQICL